MDLHWCTSYMNRVDQRFCHANNFLRPANRTHDHWGALTEMRCSKERLSKEPDAALKDSSLKTIRHVTPAPVRESTQPVRDPRSSPSLSTTPRGPSGSFFVVSLRRGDAQTKRSGLFRLSCKRKVRAGLLLSYNGGG